MDLDVSLFNLTKNPTISAEQDDYEKALSCSLLGRPRAGSKADNRIKSRVLNFSSGPVSSSQLQENEMASGSIWALARRDRDPLLSTTKQKPVRYIAQAPERILDAPELLDDFYLNLLDWSQRNIVAIALGQTVYMWNASTGAITQLMETTEEGNHITSVRWGGGGAYLAIGTNNACVQLWDSETCRQVRGMRGHEARVGALDWNEHLLSTGSRDCSILNHDVRVAQHVVSTVQTHTQEVCGLRWSPSGSQLASGGNDNLLSIWDLQGSSTRYNLTQHEAAVKALAWCPFEPNLLASGGGTTDRKIRFWNAQSGACINTIDTKSQVCSLLWSKKNKELLSSHGFSQNQLTLWKYPTMSKVTELTGHTSRVLHTALSADGTTVVSAAADETLRFWKVFDDGNSSGKDREKPENTARASKHMCIR